MTPKQLPTPDQVLAAARTHLTPDVRSKRAVLRAVDAAFYDLDVEPEQWLAVDYAALRRQVVLCLCDSRYAKVNAEREAALARPAT